MQPMEDFEFKGYIFISSIYSLTNRAIIVEYQQPKKEAVNQYIRKTCIHVFSRINGVTLVSL